MRWKIEIKKQDVNLGHTTVACGNTLYLTKILKNIWLYRIKFNILYVHLI